MPPGGGSWRHALHAAIDTLIAVGNVKEEVLLVMFLEGGARQKKLLFIEGQSATRLGPDGQCALRGQKGSSQSLVAPPGVGLGQASECKTRGSCCQAELDEMRTCLV